ncbi:hypothetical protein XAUB_40190 [Xanthomonas citri pv. aurantifolii str. ICPB 11122]|nr:hypothetical protein XAUB_40190 [Xanthomonas citri pv. aurantifolii str. ICPB 11122]
MVIYLHHFGSMVRSENELAGSPHPPTCGQGMGTGFRKPNPAVPVSALRASIPFGSGEQQGTPVVLGGLPSLRETRTNMHKSASPNCRATWPHCTMLATKM